jgi:hypothetical protein
MLSSLVLKTIITTLINQFFYSIDKAGFNIKKWKKTAGSAKVYFLVITAIAYVSWFVLMVLFQIFFHYVKLPVEDLNFVIIMLYILTLCFFIGYTVNDDIRNYAIRNNFQLKAKKKLILYNEYLSALVIFLFVLIVSAPFSITQIILNHGTGARFIFQFLFSLLLLGFLIGFLRFSMYALHHVSSETFTKKMLSGMYLFICIILFFFRKEISSFVKLFIDRLMAGELVAAIMEFIPKNINLYTYEIGYGWFLVSGLVLIVFFLLSTSYAGFLLEEKRVHIKPSLKSIRIPENLHLFINVYRKNGLVNLNFLIVFIGMMIIFSFFEAFEVSKENASFFCAFMLVNLMVHNNVSQIVLLCKRNSAKLFKTTLLLSIYPVIQFLIMYLIIFTVFQTGVMHVSFLLNGMIILGCCLYIYCAAVYILEGFFESVLLGKLSNLSVIAFIICTILLEYLLYVVFLVEGSFITYLAPVISFFVTLLVIKNFNKVRGILHDQSSRA